MTKKAADQNGVLRLLLVDDEVPLRSAMHKALEREFPNIFDIHEANSGLAAIEMLQADPFTMVISDLKMPNGSGMQIYEFIAGMLQKPYFILYTGSIDKKVPDTGGYFLGVVQKPDYESVLNRIWDHLSLQ